MFRKVIVDDYSNIARLIMKAFKNPPWNEEWEYQKAYQRIEQLNDGKYARCYVYLQNDKILGVVCGRLITYVNNLEFRIEDFYIDPDCQRMGIGQKMMMLAEKELSEVDNFALITGKNFYSVDFYKKSGFEIDEGIVYMTKEFYK